MKKILIILICTLFTNVTFGQQEDAAYKTVLDSFQKNYNVGNFDSIFSSFSIGMQNSKSPEDTKGFLSHLKQNVGNIKAREFIRYDQHSAVYKSIFEKATMLLNVSIDNEWRITGLSVVPIANNDLPESKRNKIRLVLPFKDEWTVVWGGDTKEQNYHIVSKAQKGAFDFLIKDEAGSTHKTNGLTNEDYYAFGKEITAPCDGEISMAVDGVKDNVPGVMNPVYLLGNSVIIKTADSTYLVFAHFKQHSIAVQQGQKIKKGQRLGLCGNSGNSSEPHLHFHMQDIENMNIATGVKCYFDEIYVNGQIKTDYSPVQKDKISTVKRN